VTIIHPWRESFNARTARSSPISLIYYSIIRVEHAGNGACIDGNVDPEGNEAHEEYLAAFKRTLIEKLRVSIDKSLKHDPDGGKG
jgi:hypothetical protein